MGEWKAPLSLRVRQALRAELEELALRERRRLGNLCELLLEWGVEQLKAAGSMDRLLSMSDGRSARESRLNAVQTNFRARSK
jgi:hypothetical protein